MTNKEREAHEERPTAHYISYINPNYSPFDNSSEYITKCSNCGCGLYDTAYYCPICGAKINERVVRSRYNGKIEYSPWTPCSKEMPKVSDHYLIQYSRHICPDEMAVAFYSVEEAEVDKNYTWEFKPVADCKEVIAWMPLPQRYKAESEE